MATFVRLTPDTRLAYLALILSGLLYAAHIWLTEPPQMISKLAPADQFSAERARDTLQILLQQNTPHPVGSAANQFVKSQIEKQLNQLGIEHRTQRKWACRFQSNHCAMVENLVAEIKGQSATNKIVLMAHYDSVPTSIGAGDDGAAVAAILETARILQLEAPLKRGIVLLFTDGEERGLLGAEAFFNHDSEADNISVVLNYEGSGSKGVVRVLRTSDQNEQLIRSYLEIANPVSGNSLSNEIFKWMPNDTDFSVVNRRGLNGIDFSFAEERSHYHTPNDNLKNLNLSTLQHHGNSMLPLVRELINAESISSSRDHEVYTDPYGIGLHWSVASQPWLVLAAAILWLVALLRYSISGSQLIFSAFISLLIPIVATAGGYSLFLLIKWGFGAQPNWPAHLIGFRLVLFAGPLFIALSCMLWLRRWTDPIALALTSWFWWLLITILLTVYMPDAANLWLLALVPATVLLLVSSYLPDQQKLNFLLLTLIGVIPATLAPVLQIESSQGYKLVIGMLLPIGLFLMLVMPHLMGSGLKTVTTSSLLITIIGMGFSLALPLYSELRPQQYNINFYQNEDRQQAYIAVAGQEPIPKALQEQRDFQLSKKQLLPFSTREYSFWTDTPPIHRQAAHLEQITRTGDIISFRITSSKDIAEVAIYLPTEAGLLNFWVDGQQFDHRPAANNSFQSISLIGLYGRPVELQLSLTSADPISGYLVTKYQQLPEPVNSLVDTRTPLGTPVHQGDQALSFGSIKL